MTLHAWRLPFAFDPVIGEAKRRARQRRVLITLAAIVVAGLAAGLTLVLRTGGGGPPSGGPLTGGLTTARYSDGFSLRHPRSWTRVDWTCWRGGSITSPIGLLTNARPAPTCPGLTFQGGFSFPPRERLGTNTVMVFLANGGFMHGEKLRWNASIDGKPAHVWRPEYGPDVWPGTCPAGVPSEFRSVNIAAALGVVGATICGPNLAAGNAAFGRILGSLRFTK